MRQKGQVFYTCSQLKCECWTARYIDATFPTDEWSVQEYGVFDAPDEASGEFQAMIGPEKECCYLEEETFKLKRTAMMRARNAAHQEAVHAQ